MRWDSIIPGFLNIHHVKGLKVLEVVTVLRAIEAGAGFVDALQLAVAQEGCQRDRSVADDGKRISLSLKDYLPLTCPFYVANQIIGLSFSIV